MNKHKQKVKRIILAVLISLFFISVPFAIYYNRQYDRFGTIGREKTPVFITIVAVDADRHVGTVRLTAAEYTSKNNAVKIFVMPLKRNLLPNVKYSIALVYENGILHAFVWEGLNETELQHINTYLARLNQVEGLLLSIKS